MRITSTNVTCLVCWANAFGLDIPMFGIVLQLTIKVRKVFGIQKSAVGCS
jgi:hypothetical protein